MEGSTLKKAIEYTTKFLPAPSQDLEWDNTEQQTIKQNIEYSSKCGGAFRISLHPLNLSGKRIVPTPITQREVRIQYVYTAFILIPFNN